MMLEFYNELQSRQGPGVPQARPPARGDHRRDRDHPAQGRAAEPRALPRGARHRLPHARWSRCTSRRSASAPATARRACSSTSSRARPCRASMRPATWRACRTTTCSAPSPTARSPARTRRTIAGETRFRRVRCRADRARARRACWRRPKREDGMPPNQIEYKTRRLVNDYLQPPKVTAQVWSSASSRFAEIREDLETRMMARNAHELMRALEAASILDCADMAAARLAVTAPKAAGASTTCASTIRRGTTTTGSATRCCARRDGRMTSREARRRALHRADRRRGKQDLYDRQRVRAMPPDASFEETEPCLSPVHPHQRAGHRRRGQVHRRQGLHRLRRRLPARRAAHQRPDQARPT